MIKIVIKEIIIILLLLLAVSLILGIIFYDYIPTTKQVPSKVVPYTIDEEISLELNESVSSTSQNIIRTYQITSSDLDLYEYTDDYDKGNPNPFGATDAGINNNVAFANSNTITNSNSSTSTKYYQNVSGK